MYAYEAVKNPVLLPAIQNWTGEQFLANFLPKLIGLLLVVGLVIFLFMLILGGIQWILSGGDKAALESARGRVFNAIIGIVILLSAFAVIQLVEYFFSVNILQIDLGPIRLSS